MKLKVTNVTAVLDLPQNIDALVLVTPPEQSLELIKQAKGLE